MSQGDDLRKYLDTALDDGTVMVATRVCTVQKTTIILMTMRHRRDHNPDDDDDDEGDEKSLCY